MGTVEADSSASTATVTLSPRPTVAGPHVAGTVAGPSSTVGTVRLSGTFSRTTSIPRPTPHVTLVSSKVVRVSLWAANPKASKQGRGMDGVAQITVGEGQRITLVAYMEDETGTAITQADCQACFANVFRPTIDGGEAISTGMPLVADTIYDTTQTALDSDGYNVEHEYVLDEVPLATGGSTLSLELVVELTTGERLTAEGRAFIKPNKSFPLNQY